jgi:hypothetical protein
MSTSSAERAARRIAQECIVYATRDFDFEHAAAIIREEINNRENQWKAAANALIYYCEEHGWGNMPEPHDSINPLLELLGRSSAQPKGEGKE